MDAPSTTPKFNNERISKEKLLEGARKVRVASMDNVKKKVVTKRQTRIDKATQLLSREMNQPGMKEVGLVLAGIAVVISAVVALQAYDMNRGGEGIALINIIIESIEG